MPAPQSSPSEQKAPAPPIRMSLWKLSTHNFCDVVSGLLICVAIVFGPWAFGTTDEWSIWTMNVLGLTLGLLLVTKLLIRFSTNYHFARWDDFQNDEDGFPTGVSYRRMRLALVIVSALIVAYCGVSAWNSGSTVDLKALTLAERPYRSWLPHSFDGPSSWEAFWRYLALALSFWALHDWLMGKSSKDVRSSHSRGTEEHHRSSAALPQRLTWLLWVLCINGALLGAEGIIQRMSGSNFLLFVRLPPEQVTVEAQFGPYAYRSNAGQYFNLVWPVCVGFWWMLRRNRRHSQSSIDMILRPLPLVAAGIMVLCSLTTGSRLCAFTAALSIFASAAVIWTGTRSSDGKLRAGILGLVLLIFGLGFLMGWDRLGVRLTEDNLDRGFSVRNALYDLADQMATDNPVWGTGPGTFGNLYFLYRKDPGEDWFANLHNDWLETQITFGWVGCTLIAIAFGILICQWWSTAQIGGGRRLPMLLWIALAGCFLEARWDFPFQIYSVLFVFMVVCSVLFVLSRHRYR